LMSKSSWGSRAEKSHRKNRADDLLILEGNDAYKTIMGTDEHENMVGRKILDLDHLVPYKWLVESIKFYNKSAHANNNLTLSVEFSVESTQKVYQKKHCCDLSSMSMSV